MSAYFMYFAQIKALFQIRGILFHDIMGKITNLEGRSPNIHREVIYVAESKVQLGSQFATRADTIFRYVDREQFVCLTNP